MPESLYIVLEKTLQRKVDGVRERGGRLTRNSLLQKELEFLAKTADLGVKTMGENFIDCFLKRNRLRLRSVKKFTMKRH